MDVRVELLMSPCGLYNSSLVKNKCRISRNPALFCVFYENNVWRPHREQSLMLMTATFNQIYKWFNLFHLFGKWLWSYIVFFRHLYSNTRAIDQTEQIRYLHSVVCVLRICVFRTYYANHIAFVVEQGTSAIPWLNIGFMWSSPMQRHSSRICITESRQSSCKSTWTNSATSSTVCILTTGLSKGWWLHQCLIPQHSHTEKTAVVPIADNHLIEFGRLVQFSFHGSRKSRDHISYKCFCQDWKVFFYRLGIHAAILCYVGVVHYFERLSTNN